MLGVDGVGVEQHEAVVRLRTTDDDSSQLVEPGLQRRQRHVAAAEKPRVSHRDVCHRSLVHEVRRSRHFARRLTVEQRPI